MLLVQVLKRPSHAMQVGDSASSLKHSFMITQTRQKPKAHVSAPNAFVQALHIAKLPTDCIQATDMKKAHYRIDSRLSVSNLVGRVRLELTTKGL